MRSKITSFILLAMVAILFASCLKNDDEETTGIYYNDTAITSFSLGTLKVRLHTISSKGEDSVYVGSASGASYPFYIDQATAQIYNVDSLPYGTDASHVLATITAKNSGIIAIKGIDSDNLSYYSNNDSIDFTSPRVVRVYAQNGSAYRDYTVKVNVRKTNAGDFSWSKKATVAELGQMKGMKAVAFDGHVYVFGNMSGETVGYYASETDGNTWKKTVKVFAADAYKSLVATDDALYVLSDGTIYESMDGNTWTEKGHDASLRQLVAAGRTQVFALTQAGTITVSYDSGATWKEESLDDTPLLLPADHISYTRNALSTNDNVDRIMIAGYADGKARVWTRLVAASGSELAGVWTFVDAADDARYALPVCKGMTVVPYDGNALMLGSDGDGISHVLISRDGGITWKKDSSIAEFTVATHADFTATTDAAGHIWMIGGGSGEVWNGILGK